ncbi:MAG: COX15/CtaA family protein [Planctomycetota bacterium]
MRGNPDHPQTPAEPAGTGLSPQPESVLAASEYPRYRRWVHVLTILLVLATFVLIAIGGHVTSHEAGMAVPEAFFTGKYWSLIAPLEVWWYDFGRRLEHSHRLKGYLVGSITIAVMIALLWTQGRRKWLKILGIGLLVFVIAQGILGILRVALHHNSWVTGLSFAAIHGVTGQMFFCLTVLAAAATGKFWMSRAAEKSPQTQSQNAPRAVRLKRAIRVLPLLLILGLLGQLALGSAVRHSKSALAIPDWPMHYGQLVPPMNQADIDAAVAAVPAEERHDKFALPKADADGNLQPGGYADWQVHLHFSHRLGAYALFAFGIIFTAWLWRRYPGQGAVLWPATLFAAILCVQVLLGVMTVVTGEHPTLATSHQSVGAILMATATWLAIRLHLVPVPSARPAHVPVAAGDATTEVFHNTWPNVLETAPQSTATSADRSAPSRPQPEPQTVNA